ncbi:glycosyl hydrolase [uncultured Ruminococcus sp.]|uniref:glycosyl hydrolase n=1 Tax=uncultured Ruminococcus sp. TaxID=165186 RepID=UPI0026589A6B|nr:glycosyl hydrolase [uncultured Ruminococcus sp.]
MNKWRIFSVAAAAAMLLTGCAKIEQDTMPELIAATETTPLVPVATAAEQPSHESVALQVPEITREEADITLEAEDGSIPTGCSVSIVPRLGYSGTGYLSGLNAENGSTLELEADIPATQHYDITVVLGADTPSTCRILANGEPVYTLKAEENENFVRATVQGIFLSKGKCKLEIEPVSGIVDIDCVELVNNTSLYDEDAAISQTPVNPHASASAKALLKFLADSYGRKIVTGQYVSDSTNRELEQIYQVTGAYPLIRFADMQSYSRNGGNAAQATAVEDSLAWAQEGGIAGLSWYWNAPAGNASIYAKDTTFDLSAAVTDKDIAMATDAQLSQMAASGEISEGCYAMIQDIDAVSEQLKKLADADVPVLWRPLMEAGGDWFWWGASGADAYRWLWELMYTRMTEYHQLNNLLWIWNGQSSSYQVDKSQYDIASLDVYVKDKTEAYGSRYEQYVALRNMTGGKLLALSECSTVPDMNAMFRDNAVWSFFGLWYAPYLGEYTSNDALLSVYHSEGALVRGDYQP